MKLSRFAKLIPLLVILPLFAALSSGCSGSSSQPGLAMASMDGMPENVKSAPAATRQAYQFAVANPEIMKQIGCYCGCSDLGHTSNYDCYVSGVDSGGKLIYDDHAMGCSICVDITQDAIRLLKLGKPLSEVQAYIDQTYSQYGPSNIP